MRVFPPAFVWLLGVVGLAVLGAAGQALAQAPPPPQPLPPPPWDLKLSASLVTTAGNTDTSTLGAELAHVRRWPTWTLGSDLSVLRASEGDEDTAERYVGGVRAERRLTPALALAFGWQGENDRFAGLDVRSVASAGLTWAARRAPRWTLDVLSSLSWQHEEVRGTAGSTDDAAALMQAASRVKLSPTAETRQRFAYYPTFTAGDDYRLEAEAALEASINSRLAVKLGSLLRYDRRPVPGFRRADTITTASIVVRVEGARVP